MDDVLSIISRVRECQLGPTCMNRLPFLDSIHEGDRRTVKPRVGQEVALERTPRLVQLSAFECTAATTAEDVVEGDGTAPEEDEGEGQGGSRQG
jgi:hypothetical protein